MAKRKTLPKHFDELLKTGDIEALKAVFAKCEVNAVTNRYGSNAFEKIPLPPAFAVWLKQQGGDVNQPDHYGDSPIIKHATAYGGDAALLLSLGADAHAISRNGRTALHEAAICGRIEAVQALLAHGACVHARAGAPWSKETLTPLEAAIRENRLPKDVLLKVCEVLVEAGAEITADARRFLLQAGKDFEYKKARLAGTGGFEQLNQQNDAMQRLYALLDVPPAKPVQLDIHDGISRIELDEEDLDKAYQRLWEYLVPPSGTAATAQGEAIRLAGKVCHELLDNGGINWSGEFQNMLDTLLAYLQMGVALSEQTLCHARAIVKRIYHGAGDDACKELERYAAAWVLKNRDVLAPAVHEPCGMPDTESVPVQK